MYFFSCFFDAAPQKELYGGIGQTTPQPIQKPMSKEKKDKNFIKKPIYEGGPRALKAFIGQNLRYPKAALEEKIEGTVVLKYSIDYKGKVVDAKVVSGLGHGCDEEAIRLARMLKFEVPRTRGVKVLFHFYIKIHFRLPKQKPQPAKKISASTVQYTYTEQKKGTPDKPAPKKDGEGYSYTVSF